MRRLCGCFGLGYARDRVLCGVARLGCRLLCLSMRGGLCSSRKRDSFDVSAIEKKKNRNGSNAAATNNIL